MRRIEMNIGIIIVLGLILPALLIAQPSEQFRDFRGTSYSVEDLERAMIPPPQEFGTARGLPKPGAKTAVAPNILFQIDSDDILPQYKEDLRMLGEVLKRNPDHRFRIEGHTDNSGAESYNLDLSERRAASVKRHLIQDFNIGPERLTVVGHGKRQPRETNGTPEGRQANRRVEFVTLGQ